MNVRRSAHIDVLGWIRIVAACLVALALMLPPRTARAAPSEPAASAPEGESASEDPEAPKKWIRRNAPTRHMIELSLFGGALFPSTKHDFYDPSVVLPRPPLWAVAADIGARLGYYPLRFFGLEFEYAAMPTRVRTPTDDFALLWATRGHVAFRLPYWNVTPLLVAGFGAMGVRSNDLVLGRDVDPAAHYGVGIELFATRWLALRVDGRHILAAREAQQDNRTSHFEINGGLVFAIRPKRKPKPPDPDRDKDGFLNEQDACPDVAGVAPDGCPPKDSDRDGFLDPDDACPSEPGVAPDGCPVKDTDGDGILDPDDKCVEEPETKNGFEDADGCPDELPQEVKEFTGTIEGIEFEFNKAEIRPSSTTALDKAVAVLKEYTDIRVEISGHTDNVGERDFNLDLSKRRAEAVKTYLVDKGVDTGRIVTRGAGPDEPVASNDTEDGRARNRRIEFKIVTE